MVTPPWAFWKASIAAASYACWKLEPDPLRVPLSVGPVDPGVDVWLEVFELLTAAAMVAARTNGTPRRSAQRRFMRVSLRRLGWADSRWTLKAIAVADMAPKWRE